jgi:acyl carrier protein
MAESTLVVSLIHTVRTVAHIPPSVAIQPETRLVEDLHIDSLDLVGIYLKVQDDHGVVIDEADLPRLGRIADLASYVEASRQAVSAA